MPHPAKKQQGDDYQRNDVIITDNDFVEASFDDLTDVLPNIFGFLPLKDIMRSRCIDKNSREAVKMTTIPLTDFRVRGMNKYNALAVMTEVMPNLQQLELRNLDEGHKYGDGEDPNEEEAAKIADYTTHGVGIISAFRKLRILRISLIGAELNGRYSFLFNSFPLLQKLSIKHCHFLKWDLEMLAGLPMLKELFCNVNQCLTGNINSLRVLKDTLEKVEILHSSRVVGNFMDLADFPHLKKLDLIETL